ncbi:MAG TPA: hypothetical protein PKW59_11360 [Thermotogota bacterium]|nr:hypothetical protein [Thermotogota bacterium]HQQ66752.1 hypothetical protein [Thermotogota bacterium]
MAVILTLCPAVIASVYYLKIRKRPLKSLDFPVFTIIFLFLILLCTFGVQYIRGDGMVGLFNDGYFTINYSVKFMFTGLVFSILLPHILYICVLFDELPEKWYRKIRKGKARDGRS